MMPLRITACMVSGIVTYDRWIALDGLLHHVAWTRAGRPKYWETNPGAQYELPLERVEFPEGRWCWCATWAMADWQKSDAVYVNRRFPVQRRELLHESVTRIGTSSGRFKGYRMPMPREWSSELVWYAAGDAEQVQGMLNELPNIGKKATRGHGRVREWSVEEVEEADLVDGEGYALRSLPVDYEGLSDAGREIRAYARLLPPYIPKLEQEELCVPRV